MVYADPPGGRSSAPGDRSRERAYAAEATAPSCGFFPVVDGELRRLAAPRQSPRNSSVAIETLRGLFTLL
jgi:hypothetical protein